MHGVGDKRGGTSKASENGFHLGGGGPVGTQEKIKQKKTAATLLKKADRKRPEGRPIEGSGRINQDIDLILLSRVRSKKSEGVGGGGGWGYQGGEAGWIKWVGVSSLWGGYPPREEV